MIPFGYERPLRLWNRIGINPPECTRADTRNNQNKRKKLKNQIKLRAAAAASVAGVAAVSSDELRDGSFSIVPRNSNPRMLPRDSGLSSRSVLSPAFRVRRLTRDRDPVRNEPLRAQPALLFSHQAMPELRVLRISGYHLCERNARRFETFGIK